MSAKTGLCRLQDKPPRWRCRHGNRLVGHKGKCFKHPPKKGGGGAPAPAKRAPKRKAVTTPTEPVRTSIRPAKPEPTPFVSFAPSTTKKNKKETKKKKDYFERREKNASSSTDTKKARRLRKAAKKKCGPTLERLMRRTSLSSNGANEKLRAWYDKYLCSARKDGRACSKREDKVDLVCHALEAMLGVTGGDPELTAAVADAALSHRPVNTQSVAARKAETSRNRQKKSSYRAHCGKLKKKLYRVQTDKAYRSVYVRLWSDTKAQAARMIDCFEDVAAAEGRSKVNAQRTNRCAWLHDAANAALVAAAGAKLRRLMHAAAADWRTSNHANFDGRGKFSGGFSWSMVGLDANDNDAIFGRCYDAGMPRLTAAHRGAVVKWDLLYSDCNVPSSFWTGVKVVRRAVSTEFAGQPAGLVAEAKRQHGRIEAAAAMGRNTLQLYDHIIFTGGGSNDLISNPAAEYHAEQMLLADWRARIECMLRRWHARGWLKSMTDEQVAGLPRSRLIELLVAANHPDPGAHADAELRKLVLLAYNVYQLRIYGDGASVVQTWPVVMQSVGVLYHRFQYADNLTAEQLSEIKHELRWVVPVDSWGRCSASTADANAHLRVLLTGLVEDGGDTITLCAQKPPMTLADIVSDEPLLEVAVLEQAQAAPVVKLSCRFFIGDIAHNQATMGQMAGGAGKENDPVMELSKAGRKDMGCLLLCGWRSVYENTKAYKGGPTGDGTQSWSKGDKAMWQAAYEHHGGTYTTIEAAKEKFSDIIESGVRCMSGALCGDSDNSKLPSLSMLAAMGDAMHSRGGHAHNVITQMLARMEKKQRDDVKDQLRKDGYLKHDKMRCIDWMFCATVLAGGGGTFAGVQLPDNDHRHLKALCDVSLHLYADPDKARTRGHILSAMCAGIKFGITLCDAYGDADTVKNKAKSQDAMMGLYPCGLMQLCVLSRIAPAADGICEQHEREFKPAREFHNCRVNYKMSDTLTSFRRFMLASNIERRVNTVKGKRVKGSDGKLRQLYKDMGMAPPREGSKVLWHFTQAEVRSLPFIIMILRYAADYVKAHGDGKIVCFENDEGMWLQHTTGVTIICDEEWESGADLLDITWMNARDMAAHLLPYSAALLELGTLDYPFPGWQSMQHLFNFLNVRTTTAGSEAAAPLRAFLKEAGCETVNSRHGGAQGVKRNDKGWQQVQAAYETSRRKFV